MLLLLFRALLRCGRLPRAWPSRLPALASVLALLSLAGGLLVAAPARAQVGIIECDDANPCPPDEWCRNFFIQSVCEPRAPEGAFCSPSDPTGFFSAFGPAPCLPGLACPLLAAGSRTCRPPSPVGGLCEVNEPADVTTSSCQGGLVCDGGTGACRSDPPGLNQPCGPALACASGLTCSARGFCQGIVFDTEALTITGDGDGLPNALKGIPIAPTSSVQNGVAEFRFEGGFTFAPTDRIQAAGANALRLLFGGDVVVEGSVFDVSPVSGPVAGGGAGGTGAPLRTAPATRASGGPGGSGGTAGPGAGIGCRAGTVGGDGEAGTKGSNGTNGLAGLAGQPGSGGVKNAAGGGSPGAGGSAGLRGNAFQDFGIGPGGAPGTVESVALCLSIGGGAGSTRDGGDAPSGASAPTSQSGAGGGVGGGGGPGLHVNTGPELSGGGGGGGGGAGGAGGGGAGGHGGAGGGGGGGGASGRLVGGGDGGAGGAGGAGGLGGLGGPGSPGTAGGAGGGALEIATLGRLTLVPGNRLGLPFGVAADFRSIGATAEALPPSRGGAGDAGGSGAAGASGKDCSSPSLCGRGGDGRDGRTGASGGPGGDGGGGGTGGQGAGGTISFSAAAFSKQPAPFLPAVVRVGGGNPGRFLSKISSVEDPPPSAPGAPTYAFPGPSAPNPLLDRSAPTPYIAGLASGPEVAGFLATSAVDLGTIVANRGSSGMAAFRPTLAEQPAGYPLDVPGYDLLLLVNVCPNPQLEPRLGIGAQGTARPIVEGGPARNPLFGAGRPGLEPVAAMPGYAVYGTLVPESESTVSFGYRSAAGLAGGFVNLPPGGISYVGPAGADGCTGVPAPPLVHFDFNETGNAPASRGTDRRPIKMRDGSGATVDLHSSSGEGVSGLIGDRAYLGRAVSDHGSAADAATRATRLEQTDNDAIDGLFGGFTVTGWFKTDTTSPLTGKAPFLLGNHDGEAGFAGDGFNLYFDPGSDGDLRLEVNDTSSGRKTFGTPYAAKQTWVFFAVSYDPADIFSNNVRFFRGYRNDGEAGGGPGSANVVLVQNSFMDVGGPENETVPLHVGNRPGADRPFDGWLDDVRIYDFPILSATLLDAVRQQALAGPTPPLFSNANQRTLAYVDSAAIGTSAQDQGGTTVAVDELSGVTYDAARDRFWAVSDDAGRLLEIDVDFSCTGGIDAASAVSAVSLADVKDFEGVVFTGPATNSVLVSFEDGPGVNEYSLADGSFLRSLVVPPPFGGNVRSNRALESLAGSPLQNEIVTGVEQALTVDGPDGSSTTIPTVSRWQVYDGAGNPAALQLAYDLEPAHDLPVGSTGSGLADLTRLPDLRSYLAIERSQANGEFLSRIYWTSTFSQFFFGGQNVSQPPFDDGLIGDAYRPVPKYLLLSDDRFSKLEGLALGPQLLCGGQAVIGVEDQSGSNVIHSFIYYAGSVDPVPPDNDGDGFADFMDNCSQLPNPTQLDADADGIGNRCDCDYDQDASCSIQDFNLFLSDFRRGQDGGAGTDMDGDGSVGIGDFNLFLPGFRAGEPGPSGLVP